jgi:hypothetical protein
MPTPRTTALLCAILIPAVLLISLLVGAIIHYYYLRRLPPDAYDGDVEIVRLDTATAEKAGVKYKPKDSGILTRKETERVERVVREEKAEALKEMEGKEGMTFLVGCRERREEWERLGWV